MDHEYLMIIKDVLENDEFKKRKTYHHHGKVSVYDHSLKVSYLAYKISKKFKNTDVKSVAIGGLLHDFYFKDWQSYKEKRPFFKKHGFVHAHEALLNAEKHFPLLMNDKVRNIIERHMFPLNKIPPKYLEAWIVSLADKIISMETILQPKFFLKLLGV